MKRPFPRGRKLLYSAYHLLWQGVDLLLPPSCGGCGRRGQRWCPECQAVVLKPAAPLCAICGQPIQAPFAICSSCTAHPPRFSTLRSWCIFAHPIRSALRQLKYRGDIGLAEALVPQLASFAGSLAWSVDILVPVPLGSARLRERGYNQAGLISWPLSLALDVRHAPGALRRTRETLSQVGLSRQKRHDNVRGAFWASQRVVGGHSILLVDDVATTGATLSSCAEALLAAGAQDVFALTVARAFHGRHSGADVGLADGEYGPDTSKEAT